jgi:hypothetical protein
VGRWRDLFNISYDVRSLPDEHLFRGPIHHYRKATSGALGTRAITGHCVQIIIARR